MISRKMKQLTESNSLIRAMFEEGNRLSALYGRENVYDFSLGNPSIPPPDSVRDAIIDIATNEDPLALHGYMSNAGFAHVRKSIADSLNAKHGTSFDEGNIIMSSGAAGGMNVILKTLLNPGDEVICISPFFVEYGNYIRNFDGELVIAKADRTTFQPDMQTLKAALSKKTKAVIVNSPNNPTGVVYSSDTLKQLASALSEKSIENGSPIYLISDEPYREIVYDGVKVPWLTGFYRNTIVCYSWSKSLSIPGQRIGYVIVPSEADGSEVIIDSCTIATRIMGYVNASALIQKVVEKCLFDKTDIAPYEKNRNLLYDGLSDAGFNPTKPEGAFYLWLKTPCDDKEFVAMAKKYNILLVPGSAFLCPGYARIAYCVSYDTIERSLPAFAKLAKDCAG